MARQKKNSALSRALILFVVLGLIVFFILAVQFTDMLMTVAPVVFIIFAIIGIAIYTAITSRVVYRYLGMKEPLISYVPCVGEIALIDGKYSALTVAAYLCALASFIISRLPYSVWFFLPLHTAVNMPYYVNYVTLFFLLVVQILKGIGTQVLYRFIFETVEEQQKTELGFIKSLSWLGFFPFIRVVAVYSLNFVLSSLTTFTGMTVRDSLEVTLDEDT